MPITPTYPGVYIEEIPSGVHTITGVATSITAFIGRAARGPVNVATVINSYSDYDRIFGGLWGNSTMSYAVRDFYLNGGGQGVIVRLADGGVTSTITLPQDTSLPPSPPDSPLSSSYNNLVLQAASVGSWASNLYALVDFKTKSPLDILLFNLTVTLMDPTRTQVLATEKYLNLSVNPTDPRYITNVLAQNSNLVIVQEDISGNDEVPGVRPAQTYVTILSPPQVTATPVWATTGDDGNDLNDNDFIGPGTDTNKTGLYALENVDLFNLLCIPPYLNDDSDVSTTLVGNAAAYCEKRRAFYLVDPPSTWTNKSTAVSQFTDPNTDYVGTKSDHAALFFPRLKEADPLLDNQIGVFVPSGAVAGIFARTDAQRGVWKAPAGQDASFVGVSQLSVPLTDDENGELNPLGVNCLRAFPIIGRVVWGARTLQGADELASQWKYIPVRRTALFIEESLYRGTKWVVFEPNDEPLWAQIRLNVGSFMHNLFRQGAFQGTSANSAYFVKCDSESTTQNDIDLGIVNIVVGFAPLQPAEFVVIQIQQMAGQIQV
ncbi:MAG TPA: phage tail sheath subtilisin-like domain-containing protein [Candidatus Sulfotelmatobacter sp.]|nr:phage tail sheath subtilisin-like domain-containing protein [Candidatus Sulfotelmatobacter sp.]